MLDNLVTVIIPTYNNSLFVIDSIESVLNQTYKNFEIIVVDDGSTDNTEDILKDYVNQKKIIYIKKINGGPASARNVGIREAKGKFVAFLDADDIWTPNKLTKQIGLILKNDFAAVHTDRYFFDQTNTKDWINHSKQNIQHLIKENFIVTSSLIIKTEILKKYMFNEDANFFAVEDYELWLRLLFSDYTFGYIPEKLVGYRLHKNQISSNANINNTIYIYKYHFQKQKKHKLPLMYMYLKMRLYEIRLKL